ncbi:MAG: GDP-mannose 4,6-dehydratase [Candidatus Microthrix subdominans]
MRALVTGAGGFVGAHLTAHLESSGDEVIGWDRTLEGIDITDGPAVTTAMAELRPNAVYHLAGDADVGGSWDHPASTFRANAEGTLNVLLGCRDAGVERVLVVGSADVYGRVHTDDLPITEQCPLRPVSPYAASKVAADFLAVQAGLGYGLDVIRTRPFNHLGPGQSPRFVAPALAQRVAQAEINGGGEIPVGNLTPKRDFTDVRDVVRAYRLLVLDGQPGEAYNICSGAAVAVQELVDAFIAMATVDVRLTSDPDLQRPVDIPVLLGDNSKIEASTGWQPEIPLSQTLADLMGTARSRVADA